MVGAVSGVGHQQDCGMAESTFEGIWLPRIGAAATAQLRRSSYTSFIAGATTIALAVAASFLLGAGTAIGTALGALAILLAVAAFGVVIRTRVQIANALSAWFDSTIRWWEIPRLRPTAFDAWQQKRGLAHRPESH